MIQPVWQPKQTERTVLSVSDLNRAVKRAIESQLKTIWVEGEISNFTMPGSGHWYFSLKDERAQVRAAMFARANQQLRFEPHVGMKVLARAQVSLYEPRGDYQLIVEYMEPSGLGALLAAFEQLKAKLSKEGLFDQKYKQELPELPKQIGIITSATGAALHDVLRVLHHRLPQVSVIIYPSLVQGDRAAQSLVEQINTANRRDECDVLLLVRGGGSMEDLWAFNDEQLARTIFKSAIPVVCGVGHEVDVTIAEMVADLRAPTPTAAAMHAVPEFADLDAEVTVCAEQLKQLIIAQLSAQQHACQILAQRLSRTHPQQLLQHAMQRLDDFALRLQRAARQCVTASTQQLKQLTATLHAVSPLATLARGYTITTDPKGHCVAPEQLAVDDVLSTRFSDAIVTSHVKKIELNEY